MFRLLGSARRPGRLLLAAGLAILGAAGVPGSSVATPLLEGYASASDGGGQDNPTASSGFVIAARSGAYSAYGIERGADAFALASFGQLGARSSASGTYSSGVSGASGRFRDDITITAPGVATGTTGLVGFRVAVDGSLTASNGIADWSLYYAMGTIPWTALAEGRVYQDPGGAGVTGDPAGGVYDSALALFRFGEPFVLDMRLATSTTAGSSNGSGSASALFDHTLTWEGLVAVQDYATGTPITGYVVTSASGTDYARPIPEPAAVVLMGAGLVGLAFSGRKARRRV